MEYLQYGLMGAFGALVYSLLKDQGVIFLPKRWKNGSKNGIDLGIISAIIIGAAAAIIIDRSILTAFFGSFSAPTIIENFIKKMNGRFK